MVVTAFCSTIILTLAFHGLWNFCNGLQLCGKLVNRKQCLDVSINPTSLRSRPASLLIRFIFGFFTFAHLSNVEQLHEFGYVMRWSTHTFSSIIFEKIQTFRLIWTFAMQKHSLRNLTTMIRIKFVNYKAMCIFTVTNQKRFSERQGDTVLM